LNDLRGVSVATTEFLETNGASPEAIFAADLAIEEMVSNTIKYGYSDGLQHHIEIEVLCGGTALEIEIRDDGRQFDPCAYPPPSLTRRVTNAKPAGSAFTLSATCSMASTMRVARDKTSSS